MSLITPRHSVANSTTAAIFKIGSGSVSVALVHFQKTVHPIILYTAQIPISFQKIQDEKQLTKAMLSTLLDITLKLQTEGFPLLLSNTKQGQERHIDNVLIAFAAPWYSMHTKAIVLERKKPFTVTKELLQDVIEEEELQFMKQETKEETAIKHKDKSKLIERYTIQIELNGYTSTHPYGKSVKKVKIDAVLSAVPLQVYAKTTEIVDQLLNGKLGYYHTSMLTLFLTIRDMYHDVETFLLLDISAEATDIALIHKGSLRKKASFNQGKHFFIRKVASKMNTSPEEAQSALKTYFEEKSSPDQKVKIQTFLAEAAYTWSAAFRETLSEFAQEATLPQIIFLATDSNYVQWFKKILTQEDFSQLMFSDEAFEIISLDNKLLDRYVSYKKGVSASTDPLLAIETVFFHKMLYSSIL